MPVGWLVTATFNNVLKEDSEAGLQTLGKDTGFNQKSLLMANGGKYVYQFATFNR